ncbi:IPP transferase [Gemmata obscuriglobus]|uniref:tRNA dimethylallyltransferase n=1 Tax=Gemmata obscuriglobus TaxID=114 RepID=A0A2Z3H4E3_9BACT|nr:tRNA (adenosine(37)-N6)-dimethylallyltransferase MiaA [Gemmata obscuriglobus]AWM39721.1 tRNA (adenosine(37)-N6)-dimethylallyltransferase MiaA [Gemmata obscuriglobus]QEG27166.1 IPP transferase [Gemmata obscuriglobus]VTS03796.1 trna delta -isopentenylpyrophosphate transferase : tRNA dimethylallyltransferase OS=Planctomyces maris DSM 8797 GN=miaA PE=3 SV=1: IPPT [Gemmata obscuriglobus UQM 2246]
MSAFNNAVILTGPTACGKSALALDLAERIGGEIVGLDSMTVYRGMDIGTAKPSAAERARVPHHLIDVLDPWESLTVAWWLERAEAACADITARGKVPIFVGGTPFYLKALLHGLFDGPPGDPELRAKLESEAVQEGNVVLHARLAVVDPKTAARLHPNDVRRVVRALEVHQLTGKPISDWQQTWDTPAFAGASQPAPPPVRVPAVRIDLPRETLYDRINRRVLQMIDAGFLDEVRRLRELPHPLSREAKQALGYRELLQYLDVGGDWDETVALIQTHTRQFAKRQLTWFRHLPACVPVPADAPDAADRVLRAWEAARMAS